MFLLCCSAHDAGAREKNTATLNKELSEYGISLGKAGSAPVLTSFKFRAKGMVFHTLAGEKGARRIELEIIRDISPETAARYINARYAVIKNLYDPKFIPYGGAVTRYTECPSDMKPEEISAKVMGRDVKVIITNASSRYALGVWEKSGVYKKAAFLLIHDEGNRILFQILIFSDLKDYKSKTIPRLLKGIKRIKTAG